MDIEEKEKKQGEREKVKMAYKVRVIAGKNGFEFLNFV